ncbi:hypothetical protein CEP51_013858 [Fusarium floridanum]|uniref:Uncharacterized protein n=1 Tax=Fusarium floridanum TaxID=1325733 RepID=A0A428Q3L4_9HYPO|nr:hypothetical protein CEP51_013858 [Fusarium floridanum]
MSPQNLTDPCCHQECADTWPITTPLLDPKPFKGSKAATCLIDGELHVEPPDWYKVGQFTANAHLNTPVRARKYNHIIIFDDNIERSCERLCDNLWIGGRVEVRRFRLHTGIEMKDDPIVATVEEWRKQEDIREMSTLSQYGAQYLETTTLGYWPLKGIINSLESAVKGAYPYHSELCAMILRRESERQKCELYAEFYTTLYAYTGKLTEEDVLALLRY